MITFFIKYIFRVCVCVCVCVFNILLFVLNIYSLTHTLTHREKNIYLEFSVFICVYAFYLLLFVLNIYTHSHI